MCHGLRNGVYLYPLSSSKMLNKLHFTLNDGSVIPSIGLGSVYDFIVKILE